MSRKIILHHHIFKNAGSTVDRWLERNLGADKVVAYDKVIGPGDKHFLSGDEMLPVLNEHPDCLSFSSHQSHVQDFDIDGFEFIDFALVRHPIDRLRSIHSFYNASPELKTPFSIAAQEKSLTEFMVCLADGKFLYATESIQTTIFGTHFSGSWVPPHQEIFDKAIARIKRLKVLGVVERFDEGVLLLGDALQELTDSFNKDYEVVNQTSTPGSTLEDRLEQLKEEIGNTIYTKLVDMNHYDILLWEFANKELTRRLEER